MTSSNGKNFRVTGPLCGEFTGPGEFPAQRPVTRSFDVYFDLRLNKRLSKQSWRHRNGNTWPRRSDRYGQVSRRENLKIDFCTRSLANDTNKHISVVVPIKDSGHTFSLWSLQRRHHERVGLSNHQPHDCLFNRLFRQIKGNIKALRRWRYWPVVWGIRRWIPCTKGQ